MYYIFYGLIDRYAREVAFSSESGARDAIVDVLVVMTDGGTFPGDYKQNTFDEVHAQQNRISNI